VGEADDDGASTDFVRDRGALGRTRREYSLVAVG
jgi:hypothetical protein